MNDEREHPENKIHAEGPECPVANRPFSFSRRNLIAVVVLLGVLLAMILPIIARNREEARRAKCQDNLKQLAVAVHNYESAFKKLPIGIQVIPGRNDSAITRGANWSWSIYLIPYTEQAAAYDVFYPRYDNCFSDCITASAYANGTVTMTDRDGVTYSPSSCQELLEDAVSCSPPHLSIYHCPSDPSATGENRHRSGVEDSDGLKVAWPKTGAVFDIGTISYVGANSSRQCFALNGSSNPANGESITEEPDGMFHAVRPMRFRDVRDGQNNTVLLSERILGSLTPRSDRNRFGKVISAGAATVIGSRGIGNSSIDGSATNDVADAWGAPDVLFSAWGGINLDDPARPWRKFQGVSSYHPGGVNIARVDGSVEFFANVDVPDKLNKYILFSTLKPPLLEIGPSKHDEWVSRWEPENLWRKQICRDDLPALLIE
jgi:prepilin-type processing-associated H-X9-DG protein